MTEPLAIEAIFARATTTIDGGWRISFDLDASQGINIAKLAEFREKRIYLVIMTEEQKNERTASLD